MKMMLLKWELYSVKEVLKEVWWK